MPARTAFVFPGLNGCAHAAEHLPLLRLPGFVARWQVVVHRFAARAGFAAFADALFGGRELPSGAAVWPLRALTVTAMQLAMAERLEAAGEHADWLCGYSIGDVARACHAGVCDFADVVDFAAALPPLADGPGTTAALHGASPAVADRLAAAAAGLGLDPSRLSPRFLLVAGGVAPIAQLLAAARELRVHGAVIGACPLHARAQQPLAARLRTALARHRLRPPRRPLFSTLWGRAVARSDDLRAELAANVAAPCDFATAVRRLHEDHGVSRFVDLGPGRHAQRFVRHHELPLTAVAAADLPSLSVARA